MKFETIESSVAMHRGVAFHHVLNTCPDTHTLALTSFDFEA